LLNFGDKFGRSLLVSPTEVDVRWVLSGDEGDRGSTKTSGTFYLMLVVSFQIVKDEACLPPVMRKTRPDWSGTSVAGLKEALDMLIFLNVDRRVLQFKLWIEVCWVY
jgi:hypothetical protein